ncbi:hypothetical protein CLPUN_26880 [Clostridium puniceum]|uniref:DUF4489 domain-containing protein n=1 Tax=Clostridium puniceum TaxID=29367 RepID=A0A1S8TFK6_9CLOT|nr:DUF4489 domain-containing protein [Clostridium puniceum]OOM76456.1 hypothetical protein CLPUN_26880 [Clostridium puniceum]
MNIISENQFGFEDSIANCRRRDFEDVLGSEVSLTSRICRNTSPEPGRSLLSCGSGGVGPLPMISTQLSRPIPVASVSIDTTNMCNPKILLTFTCLIVLPATIMVNLNFVIVKTTDGGAPQEIGGTHTFSEIASVLESESFCFQYCDCSPCHSCTTYTIKLEPSSLIAETAGLTITNATLTALAVETLI